MGCGNSSASSPEFERLTSADAVQSHFENKYRWGREAGEGGFATVRVATHRVSDIQYAAKCIDLKVGKVSAHITACIVGRAKDEVGIWRMLGQNEHIVQLHEAFSEPLSQARTYIIVMELCEASLLERLEQVRVSTEMVSRVFRESLFGIQHMHAKDICHRDIKPANVLLGGADGETVKLCDFGFAVVVPEEGISLKPCGSPSYMSPELAGHRVFMSNTDVWSMGVTCYVVVYGCLPYTNSEGDVRDVIIAGDVAPAYVPAPNVEPQKAPTGSEDFLRLLLVRDPQARCSAEDALHHQFVWPECKVGERSGGSCDSVGSCADLSTAAPASEAPGSRWAPSQCGADFMES